MTVTVLSSRLVLATSAAAWASGCLSIDERMLDVKPNPIALNDFENMNAQPADARFGAWQFGWYNTDPGGATGSLVMPGENSVWCLGLHFELTDPVNGKPDYPGALQRTLIVASIDLRPYTRLVFSHSYQNTDDTGACQPLAAVLVRLTCGQLASGYERSVATGPDWQKSVLDFGDFSEITYLGPKGVSRQDCLGVIDEVQIIAQPVLQDGQCSRGDLLIDNVSIR